MVDLMTLAFIGDFFKSLDWWQYVLIVLLIAIIVFYVMYRKKQM